MRAPDIALYLVVLMGATFAHAHETRPVFLELSETMPGRFDGQWRVPSQFGIPLPVEPVFDERCEVVGSTLVSMQDQLSASARFTLTCASGLSGSRITLAGLNNTQVDGLVRVHFISGELVGTLLHPGQADYEVPNPSGGFQVFQTYAQLGMEHIASGIDHLLFVTALVLLIGMWRRVLIAVTAFTIAHSISLALAALKLIFLPIHATEALIALSILFLAVELAQKNATAEFQRRPWVLAFAFGLLHGLGFASGLAEIGLPNHEIPIALLSFNIGVEAGQFTCVAFLLLLGSLGRSLPAMVRGSIRTAMIYSIGGLASFWFIERVLAI